MERDTSAGHIHGPIVNGCANCRLCGRQNGMGKLLEFLMRRCTSRDQELRCEVMSRIPKEPRLGRPRAKWRQLSLKSWFATSVGPVCELPMERETTGETAGIPAVSCAASSSSVVHHMAPTPTVHETQMVESEQETPAPVIEYEAALNAMPDADLNDTALVSSHFTDFCEEADATQVMGRTHREQTRTGGMASATSRSFFCCFCHDCF